MQNTIMMKVFMIQDYRKFNPYQIFLDKALKEVGIKSIFPIKNYRIFPIIRNILNYKPDIIHFHWIHDISGFLNRNIVISNLKLLIFILDIYLIKYILKTKIVWTIHNIYSHDCFHPYIERFIRKLLSNKANVLICHCNQAKKEIRREFGTSYNKINVIPIGNYLNWYKNKISKKNALKYLNLNSSDFIFLSFGPIKPYKGINNLIKSFNTLDSNRNVKLLVIGEPKTDKIKTALIKNSKDCKNIKFVFNFVNDDDLQIYFNASDVVVFSYQKILTSAGIPLAMSFSKPIIAPRLGCILEILDDKGSFLYNSFEDEGLSKVLEKAIENQEYLKEMGEHNLHLAKLYKWKKIAIETKKIYFKILK